MSAAIMVVRLGGSHAFSPWLRPWLAAIRAAAGGVVVVPGGGPFADAVRLAQTAMGFDDLAAHRMALLAMAQYGLALAGLGGPFIAIDTMRMGAFPSGAPGPCCAMRRTYRQAGT
jgi:aspartokinase-like uncharacterized kinase